MTISGQLRRSTTDKVIGDVYGGLARYFAIVAGLVRVGGRVLGGRSDYARAGLF
ncbi:MAG: PspC domain-containing protein [Caldilineaceae bacterium]